MCGIAHTAYSHTVSVRTQDVSVCVCFVFSLVVAQPGICNRWINII